MVLMSNLGPLSASFSFVDIEWNPITGDICTSWSDMPLEAMSDLNFLFENWYSSASVFGSVSTIPAILYEIIEAKKMQSF